MHINLLFNWHLMMKELTGFEELCNVSNDCIRKILFSSAFSANSIESEIRDLCFSFLFERDFEDIRVRVRAKHN